MMQNTKLLDKQILFIAISSIFIFVSPVVAQDNKNEDRAGLTCQQMLSLGKKTWEEYFYKVTGDSSLAGTDRAYVTYAECHRERNNRRLAAFPNSTRQRINTYRNLYQKYRHSHIGLTGAYVGGGTMFGHASARTSTLDEELVETLINLYSESKSSNNSVKKGIERKIKIMRNKISQINPNIPKNRRDFVSAEYIPYGVSSYADLESSLNSLSAMLLKENSKVGLAVLNFIDKANNIFSISR
ncbi:hypothetical protein ACQFX9_17680 [Aliinostoc sp. HNIBRCY26]|uniref:hypothetical protein n=1 Tax=Aliinostoc sp. HNIBRCY26 TaxID=3418997 RepID=UPI003D022836